jgi:hypothetical protein
MFTLLHLTEVFQVRISVRVCEAPFSGKYLRLSPLDFLIFNGPENSNKVPVEGKNKNWFLGQNNIYTSSGKREFTSLVTV